MSDPTIGELTVRVEQLEERVDDYHARLRPLEGHKQTMEGELRRVGAAEGRLEKMDERWQTLQIGLVELKTRITTIGVVVAVLIPVMTGTITALIVRYVSR